MTGYGNCELLLSGYFEGSITSAELAELEKLLIEDPEAARHAAEWCLMHRQIGELLTEDQLHELMDQFATRSPLLRQELFKKRVDPKPVVTKGISQVLT